MSRPPKPKEAEYSLLLNNIYNALYMTDGNPYPSECLFEYRASLTEDFTKAYLKESQGSSSPFLSRADARYKSLLGLYSRNATKTPSSSNQRLFLITHLAGWRPKSKNYINQIVFVFNDNRKITRGLQRLRIDFLDDLLSWEYRKDPQGNYLFSKVTDSDNQESKRISEYIVECNCFIIQEFCHNKNALKELIYNFAENMEDAERKRSESVPPLNNLHDQKIEVIVQLRDDLNTILTAYDSSEDEAEKDMLLARGLTWLIIAAMLRTTFSLDLMHRCLSPYLPQTEKHGTAEVMDSKGERGKERSGLSVSEQFWQAGKNWYEDARKPGARFHSLDIVNHILPSAENKPAESEYSFSFRATDTNENTIQCSRFSELLQDKNSVYHQGHFMLIGEGGIGKTTTLMSAMQDAYEGRDSYQGESVIPLFVELSLAPDSQEAHAYDGTSSSVIHRLIYTMLQQKDSKKEYSDLLRECMNEESSIARDTVRELLTAVTNDETRFVLLIDGLNEVSPEPFTGRSSSAQWRILQEIREMMDKYPNVTVILTGRQGAFIDHPAFHPFYLRGLVWEEIETYLREKGKTEEEISLIRNDDTGLLNILSVPMFLTMFILLHNTEGITTRGEFLKVFFHERLERRKNEYTLQRQGDISERIDRDEEQSVSGKMTRGKITLPMQWMFLDILIPEIAAKMERAHDFRISERDVHSLLESLFKGQDSLYCGNYKEFSNVCFAEQLQGDDLEDVISDFTETYRQKVARYSSAFLRYCESSMGILYREGEKSYGFVHQHFRDYFAAVCNVNRMKIAYMAFQEDALVSARNIMRQYEKDPLDPVLMIYIGEYLGEHHNVPHYSESAKVSSKNITPEECLRERQLIRNLLDIYREVDQENAYGVYNLIEILKRVRIDLSGSDLHDLDLRRCHFYRVPLDSGPETILTGAIINANNWFAQGHFEDVNSANFNGDGSRVVTASDDGTARIWDSRTGELLHILKGHSGVVRSAKFSADSICVATASYDGTARIWDSQTGELLHTLKGHSEPVSNVEFSSCGRYVVTASWDTTACIWDRQSGDLLHTLNDHSGSFYSANFNGDGNYVITASLGNIAHIWDSRTGELLHTLKGHSDGVVSAEFSSCGRYVVTASWDTTACIWDSRTGELLHTLKGHTGWLRSAKFSGDGTRVVTASADNTARIWDSRTGKLLLSLEGHSNIVNSAVFSVDGRRVATASADGTTRIWDSQTGKPQHTLYDFYGEVISANFNGDGTRVVTASTGDTARIWDSRTGKLLHTLEGQSNIVFSAKFSLDGSHVVTASSDGTARIWDSRTWEMLHTLEGHSGLVIYAKFSTDQSRVVTASSDRTARIWDSRTGKLLHILKGHSDILSSANFNEDGNYVVTTSFDGTARIWDSWTGKMIHTLKGHSKPVNVAIFDRDGRRVVTVSDDDTACIWDSRTGELLHTLNGCFGNVNDANFSRDGNLVVTAEGTWERWYNEESYNKDVTGAARIWDSRTGELLHTLKGHSGAVLSASFSRDGTRVATASADNTACIWDSRTGKLLHILNGCFGEVTDVVFNRDGSCVVTASLDNTVRIWDSRTGELLHTLEGHFKDVTNVNFSEDGKRVITSSCDGTTRIWEVKTGKVIKILYETSGLFLKGVNFKEINTRSIMIDKQKELFRQYGAII